MAFEGGNIVRFTYTGANGEVIDEEATHITVDKDCTVVRARAFLRHPNIVELICHDDVEMIEQEAFSWCRSLKRVIIRGVKIVEQEAFRFCGALEDVEWDKLEMIGKEAFYHCRSLRSINLSTARTVGWYAFAICTALTNVKFGSKLERIEEKAFYACYNLERITIPMKNGLFTEDGIFTECSNLCQVDLVEGELHETIAALHLEEWRNDMNDEIDSINQIFPTSPAGGWGDDRDDVDEPDPGEKTQAIRSWIRSVLRKIIHYQTEHRHLLNEAATALEHVLPNNDIVMNNVIPFHQLPSYRFEVEHEEDGEEEDSDDDTQSSESSLGDEEYE